MANQPGAEVIAKNDPYLADLDGRKRVVAGLGNEVSDRDGGAAAFSALIVGGRPSKRSSSADTSKSPK
jgi:hypothetical protein